MSENTIQQQVLDIEQTTKRIDQIDIQLNEGNLKGSGRFRYGIQGDIEHLMGWYGNKSLQTPLTEPMRVQVLRKFKVSAEKSLQPEKLGDITRWLSERIEEVVLNEADRVIKSVESIPEDKKGMVMEIIDKIKTLEASLDRIMGSNDTHPYGIQYLAESQKQEKRDLITQIKSKKFDLFDSIYT